MSEYGSERGIKDSGNNNTSGCMGWEDTTATGYKGSEKIMWCLNKLWIFAAEQNTKPSDCALQDCGPPGRVVFHPRGRCRLLIIQIATTYPW